MEKRNLFVSGKAVVAAVCGAFTAAFGWLGWLVVAWAACMALDWVSGSAAAASRGAWSSAAARAGIWHKAGMVVVVLALFYPFASVEAGTVTRLSVRLVCAGGTVKIAPYGIKATVTGQGMASETPWDGTLECEETLLPIAIKARSINV